MKKVIIGLTLWVLAAVAMSYILVPGWDHQRFGWMDADKHWHGSIKEQRRTVEFIHEHRCVVKYDYRPSGEPKIGSGLQITTDYGVKEYVCPGFSGFIYIADYELQP